MKRKGFTLIEMLISIVIFSFVIALAAYSFRLYANIVKKIVMPYPQQAVEFSKLEDSLKSIFYFTGERKNIEGKLEFFTYFYGGSDKVKFISAESVNSDSGIYICNLYVDNSTLILEESPVYSKYNNYKNPFLVKNHKSKTVIMKDVSKMELTYFINGFKTNKLTEKIPDTIKIDIKRNNKNLTLYFNIKSDFRRKKDLTRFFYAPF